MRIVKGTGLFFGVLNLTLSNSVFGVFRVWFILSLSYENGWGKLVLCRLICELG